MNTCKFHRANKKLATTGPGKCVIHLFYVILFIKLSDKPFSFYLLSCYDRDCYFDKNWSSSKPSVLSLLLLSLKLSGNIAEKAKYPTPAPASTAAPNQALYVITINISTYPTNTCTVWRNVCRMCILLFHLVPFLGNLAGCCCRVSFMLDASWLSVISSLVDLDFHKSLIKRRSGLQTSHCLNILRPSYRAVIKNVDKQAPTKTIQSSCPVAHKRLRKHGVE